MLSQVYVALDIFSVHVSEYYRVREDDRVLAMVFSAVAQWKNAGLAIK